jgi:hypothetical protein
MATMLTTRVRDGRLERHAAIRQYAGGQPWMLYLVVGCLVTISLWTPGTLRDTVGGLGRYACFGFAALLGALASVQANYGGFSAATVARSSYNRHLKAVRP